jgi:hypothetical protein
VSATGWYVYGVVDADRTLDDVGMGVRLVRDDSLAAIVAPVDLAEFGDLTERLNDRAWLERKALDHETVLSRLTGDGPVVPLRFGAIYHRLEDVSRLLEERRDEFASDLERVRGCVELGVKGFVDRSVLEDALARERTEAPATAPGRAYLERRQVQREVADEAATILTEAARSAHARLLERSVAGTVSRPHSRELSGRAEEMFLNAAYLVSAVDESLRDEVAELGRAYAPLAVTFEVTGPWPPYNFVGERDREQAIR